jgi:pyruvate dehydrogenase E2 component (dihydrolipoamide acetyltransferase)
MASELKIPRLSESADVVSVTEIHVKEGDTVEQDQILLVVNADKSTADVRSTMAGKLTKLTVKVGDEVKVGAVYAHLEASGATSAPPAAPTAAPSAAPAKPTAAPAGAQQRKNDAVEEPTPSEVRAIKADIAARAGTAVLEAPPGTIVASPGTRWLARKLGVDITALRGSGPRGRVTEDDVKSALGGGAAPVAGGGGGTPAPALPDFEKFGPVVREPLSAVRKLTARQMSIAWTNIPHVTQFDSADITDLEAFRKSREGKGPKVTVTAFVMKACASALRQFPHFNSSLDLASGHLVLKQFVNIGVAVDTKGGLLVPVIKDVDKKGVNDLAQELNDTAEKARTGKAEMKGGTFTITNLGGIGGTGFTPIVNWPEVAILGLSRSRMEPVWKDGQWVPRLMMPLSLSYDHRVIDGADAARFTRRVAEMLENPWLMTL